MRLVVLAAAFGFVMGAPVVAPATLMNVAEAQAATMTQEEMTLQARIVALAQAGDTAGLTALINQQVAAGKTGVLARVAKSIAAMAQQLASTDSTAAAAIVNAAIQVVSNSTVASSDASAAAAVGSSAAGVVNTIGGANPIAAASVQTAVAQSTSNNLQVAFVTPNPQFTATGSTNQQQTCTTNRVVVVPPRPRTPTNPIVPVIIEPNPDQSGSPT